MTAATPLRLSVAQKDRAAGALLGTACGDALGAGYEFGPPLDPDTDVRMKGGGGFDWEPGEWTDDTSMAIPIARTLADGFDLRDETILDAIVATWVDWAKAAPDVGIQTSAILEQTEPTSAAIRVVARAHHDRAGRSGGNGSLMRTAPVALGFLDDPSGLAVAARIISDLTHVDEDAGDACVLWCLAIRHAVRTGELDVGVGLPFIPAERQALWADRIREAEEREPREFERNGWVVHAFQGAWSAISGVQTRLDTGEVPADHLREAIERAVRGGRDTDTVAAIAGGLVGAAHGASAVPAEWRRIVHGWPGLAAADLVRMGVLAASAGRSDSDGWPTAERFDYSGYGDVSTLVRHPHDDGVWLGGVGVLDDLPSEIDAVISLCRVGTAQVPTRVKDHVEFWLIDSADEAKNPNLTFVLWDAADTIASLRAEGKTVLVHCVQAMSRTPTVAALYSGRHRGVPVDEVWDAILAALPAARPNKRFRKALYPRGMVYEL